VGERCYLDWNATVPVRPEAAAASAQALRSGLGNASSVHAEGRRARRLLEEARTDTANLLGAMPEEVVFTSGGTEANVAGVWGLIVRDGRLEGRRLLHSAVEHPAVVAMADELARLGVTVEAVPVLASGVLDVAALEDALRRHADAVVAVQLANSETGVMQDLAAIVAQARAAGATVHCDAVQGAGKVPIAADAWGVDTLAVTGHKLGASPGVGALVVRRGTAIAPLIPGSQEGHRRGGTENLPGIVALGVAARLAAAELDAWQALSSLRDRFEGEVLQRIVGTVVYGRGAPRLPNTSCVGLPEGMRGGAVVAALDIEGFAVSSGPACSSGVERGSPTVHAMGFGQQAAERTLRVSMGPGTGEGEMLGLAVALERVTRRSKGVGRDRELPEL
jgi:cysteine desulfurase